MGEQAAAAQGDPEGIGEMAMEGGNSSSVPILLRSLRRGEVIHTAYPLHAFHWIEQYPPKKYVGETIRLCSIPPGE